MRPSWLVPLALLVGGPSCVGDEAVPPGKLAVVGPTVLGPEDLSGVQSQLGSYAQLRFAGLEGRAALLEALVAAELMAQAAIDEGLGDDPRVEWAILEEEAALYLAAELERRVPRAEVAADTAALAAWYDAHPTELWTEELRNLEGVVFDDHVAAADALRRLRAGEVELEALGDMVATGLQRRDDAEYPGFHSILFDDALGPGDLLPVPVVLARKLIVARVQQVVPATRKPFDDPEVQERLVREVRGPRLAEAREQLLAELAERYPEQTL